MLLAFLYVYFGIVSKLNVKWELAVKDDIDLSRMHVLYEQRIIMYECMCYKVCESSMMVSNAFICRRKVVHSHSELICC